VSSRRAGRLATSICSRSRRWPRGDERYVGRALDLAAPLVTWRLQNVIDPATQRAILAAATLARHGLDTPWEAFLTLLLPRVEESIERGGTMRLAQVAATLDAAAMVFGLLLSMQSKHARSTPMGLGWLTSCVARVRRRVASSMRTRRRPRCPSGSSIGASVDSMFRAKIHRSLPPS